MPVLGGANENATAVSLAEDAAGGCDGVIDGTWSAKHLAETYCNPWPSIVEQSIQRGKRLADGEEIEAPQATARWLRREVID